MPKTVVAPERPQISAQARAQTGTRAARRARREGFVPGVLYGKATKPTAIIVNRRDVIKLLQARAGEHSLLTLRLETRPAGGPEGKPHVVEKSVLIKDVAHDPVDGEVRHIDFQAIVLTEEIRVKVPLVLKGEAVGVKQDGGVLEHFLREIEVECLPTAIPEQIEHDISALKIGETLHVRDLAAPAGTRVIADAEGVIASVLTPRVEKVEEAVAEAAAEPEVIREKKPEAEEAAAEGRAEKPEKGEKAEETSKKEK